jgi:single-strand DNA-binding protein
LICQIWLIFYDCHGQLSGTIESTVTNFFANQELSMYHKIILVGNLGRDPEMRYTPSGQAVTSFNVAISDGFGDKKRTIWVRVSAWEKLAETCNTYLKKGSKVLVEGRFQSDPATGGPRVFQRQDGSSGASYEITASTVRFLTSRNEAESSSEDYSEQGGGIAEDDIPF